MSWEAFQDCTSHGKMTTDDNSYHLLIVYFVLGAFIYLILDSVLSAGHTVMNRIVYVVPC